MSRSLLRSVSPRLFPGVRGERVASPHDTGAPEGESDDCRRRPRGHSRAAAPEEAAGVPGNPARQAAGGDIQPVVGIYWARGRNDSPIVRIDANFDSFEAWTSFLAQLTLGVNRVKVPSVLALAAVPLLEQLRRRQLGQDADARLHRPLLGLQHPLRIIEDTDDVLPR
jgi:hypothetical protein